MAKYDKSKFYWLQLKEDFFDEDAIDWLEEQPNGKEYVLFYLKLCLKSLKTNGMLIRQVGNVLVPYDYKKLGELTKTNPDTVIVAMELLMQIGLVQKLENGEFYMTQLENMTGSQSKGASKKQQQRLEKKEKELLLECEKQDSGQEVDKCPPKIDIDIRDKDIYISKENNIKESKIFKKPTLLEVEQYCKERNNNVDPQSFIDFYESKGWLVGKAKMKDWKAAIRTWERNRSYSNNYQPKKQEEYVSPYNWSKGEI